MRRLPDRAYYLAVLHLQSAGRESWSVFSEFVKFSERNDGWEVRRAALVDGAKFRTKWATERNRWLTVRTTADLAVLLRVGGVALFAPAVVEAHMSRLLEARECAPDRRPGAYVNEGFLSIRDHSKRYPATNRLAKGKLRMHVFERDDYRCVVCGRRAGESIDIQLNVHHIIPFADDGPTVESNLATLCGACHVGLDNYDRAVRALARLPGDVPRLADDPINDGELRDNIVKGIPLADIFR